MIKAGSARRPRAARLLGVAAAASLVACAPPEGGAAGSERPPTGDTAPVADSAAPGDTEAPPADTGDPIDGWAMVEENPDNPFSAVVTAFFDRDVTAWVEYGEGGAFDRATPPVSAADGELVELLVLGLRAGREHQLRVVAEDDGAGDSSERYTGEALPFQTAPLPGGWPDCTASGADPTLHDAEEAICTNGLVGGRPIYYCVDRWGEPVWSLRHPEDEDLWAVRALSDGGFAAVSTTSDRLSLFDQRGALTAEYRTSWLDGRARFTHQWIDMHEVIELGEGPWAGALAFITLAIETTDEGVPRTGAGVVVMQRDGEVLWDWSAHGKLGDGVPIDPKLDYERDGLKDGEDDWQHANALVHLVDDDGRQSFWLSLRTQDWIIKVDVETDAVVWRLGYEGDFALVDDLDAAAPAALSPGEWMVHQHAPEIIERSGDRTRFLVFDNGYPRRGEDGQWNLESDSYSRVVAFELDEATMQAAPVFDHGPRDAGDPDHFYSYGGGDADRLPGGEALMFVSGWQYPTLIEELSYPGGEPSWRFECQDVGEGQYRVNYFPSLYKTAP
jgi:hypothetical protein